MVFVNLFKRPDGDTEWTHHRSDNEAIESAKRWIAADWICVACAIAVPSLPDKAGPEMTLDHLEHAD